MGKQLHCGVSRTSHPCCLPKMRFPSLREHISREKSVRAPLCVFISNLPPVEDTWQTASAPSALIVASDGCPGAKWALFSTDPSPPAPPRGLQRFFKWLKNRFWSSSVTMLCNNSSVIICYHYLICHITPSPDKKNQFIAQFKESSLFLSKCFSTWIVEIHSHLRLLMWGLLINNKNWPMPWHVVSYPGDSALTFLSLCLSFSVFGYFSCDGTNVWLEFLYVCVFHSSVSHSLPPWVIICISLAIL